LRHQNVVITPHIGEATHETIATGLAIVVDEIDSFVAGAALKNVINRQSVRS
jgi:phosphoglycerate dehydrogenase-like enzyme